MHEWDLLTIAEIAAESGIPADTLRRRRRALGIAPIRLGSARLLVFTRAEARKLTAKQPMGCASWARNRADYP